jgi:phosphate transport system substrate-binding protein
MMRQAPLKIFTEGIMVNKLSLLVAVCAVVMQGAAFAGNDLSYSGSSTIGMGILEAGAQKAYEEKTGKKFTLVEMPGSGKGIQALLDGKVSIAGVSRALKKKEINQKLAGTEIGYDAIAIFVNANNPVQNLSKEQLKGIFTGRIRNWRDVGGKDMPIEPNTEIAGAKRATMLEFQEMIMDNAPYGEGFKQIDFPRDQIIETAKNEKAICTVSRGLIVKLSEYMRTKVKTVTVNGSWPTEADILSRAYIISRPLLLVTKGNPTGEAKQFIDFMLSSEGQKKVMINFVRVKQ